MPELPEVETLCRQLKTILPGEEILRIEILDARLEKIQGLVGRRVEAVKRRGKFLQICISGGLTAELHLRMSGRLFWQKGGVPLPSRVRGSKTAEPLNGFGRIGNSPPLFAYSRLLIDFPAGTLILIDPRRFATFTVQPVENTPALVEDALGGLSARRLREIARTRRLPVKSFLMDQRLIAGIGNIYACEILFAAGIDPRRPFVWSVAGGMAEGGEEVCCDPRTGCRLPRNDRIRLAGSLRMQRHESEPSRGLCPSRRNLPKLRRQNREDHSGWARDMVLPILSTIVLAVSAVPPGIFRKGL